MERAAAVGSVVALVSCYTKMQGLRACSPLCLCSSPSTPLVIIAQPFPVFNRSIVQSRDESVIRDPLYSEQSVTSRVVHTYLERSQRRTRIRSNGEESDSSPPCPSFSPFPPFPTVRSTVRSTAKRLKPPRRKKRLDLLKELLRILRSMHRGRRTGGARCAAIREVREPSRGRGGPAATATATATATAPATHPATAPVTATATATATATTTATAGATTATAVVLFRFCLGRIRLTGPPL